MTITLDITFTNFLQFVIGPVVTFLIGVTIPLVIAVSARKTSAGARGGTVLILLACGISGVSSLATYSYYFGLGALIVPVVLVSGFWSLLFTGILK